MHYYNDDATYKLLQASQELSVAFVTNTVETAYPVHIYIVSANRIPNLQE